ncbi:MAG: permease, partial [Sedimentisphaerales bacterium]|nr:permease [Sedimentisphaerales bacterium]
RPLAAFATGVVGGVLVNLFGRPSGSDVQQTQHCTDECCSGEHSAGRITRVFKYGFVTLPRDIGRAMLLGLIVAAFISALVPDGFFADKLGTGILAMLVMMAIGIPMYVCATASVPIAAALMMKGLTPGAALVFLMTGPATNAASFVTIWKIMGRATAITYLASVAGCALLSGILLDYIVSSVTVEHMAHHTWMLPPVVKYISAVVLFAVLAFAILRPPKSVES